jgi:acyl carrier protein
MELNRFVKNFAIQFEDTDASKFKAETVYKDLEEWSSLTALAIIAMVDEEYNVRIKGDDIRNSSTIDELFHVVINKKN